MRAVKAVLQSGKEWLYREMALGANDLGKSSLGSYLTPFQKSFLELDQKFKYIFKKQTIIFTEENIKLFFFFLIYLFIYLFLAALGLHCCVRASHCGDFSMLRSTCSRCAGFSSCGARA